MNSIPLISNVPGVNFSMNRGNASPEVQMRQEINTSLVALKKEAGTLEGLINEASQILDEVNNRIAALENDTVKKSDVVDVVQSGNMNPVTSNAVAGAIGEIINQNGDLNTIYPSENGKVKYYRGNFTNAPETRTTAIVRVERVQSVVSSGVQLYQEWVAYGDDAVNYAPNKYFRFGYFAGSDAPTWSDWQKVIRDRDLGETKTFTVSLVGWANDANYTPYTIKSITATGYKIADKTYVIPVEINPRNTDPAPSTVLNLIEVANIASILLVGSVFTRAPNVSFGCMAQISGTRYYLRRIDGTANWLPSSWDSLSMIQGSVIVRIN